MKRTFHRRTSSLQALLTGLLILNAVAIGGGKPILAQSADGTISRTTDADARVLLRRLEPDVLAASAASKNMSPADLRIVNSALAHFPLQGRVAYGYKLVNEIDGAGYRVVLDENGRELDEDQLRAAEQAAYEARYGRLEPVLANRLPSVDESLSVPVIVWLKDDGGGSPSVGRPDPEARLSESEMDAVLATMQAERKASVERAVAPVAERLGNLGFNFETSDVAPVIIASLPPSAIREIQTWSEVDRVYLDRRCRQTLDISRASSRMSTAETTFGARGAGITAGIVEVGGDVAFNPFLGGTNRLTAAGFNDSHGTLVAGIIKSTHATVRGFAPSCTLLAGSDPGGAWSGLQAVATREVNAGALVLNLSFGETLGAASPQHSATGIDRFYDSIVYNNLRSVVVAAGNEGLRSGNCTSPSLGFNVIAVGNYDDRNTASLADDVMRGSSSFVDPLSTFGDREKPEIAAPGTNITGPDVNGGVAFTNSGTSFSAPAVTGTIAAMQGQNVNLRGWPEAVKAILMATAVHNIEGSSRLSEKDGAGGMDSYRAIEVTQRVRGNWGGVSFDCSSPMRDIPGMSLVAGRVARVAITFQSDPNYSNYANEPSADLDLRVLDPSGREVGLSNSYDNSYEIIEFVPAIAGSYTIRVNDERCGSSPRAFGWAWYQM